MTFKEAVDSCIGQYAGFSGRARRSEYWYFFLFRLIASGVIGTVASIMDLNHLMTLWSLAIFLPTLAAEVRRMHDIGKSGYALLIHLVPLVGSVLYLFWTLRDSAPDNVYGPSPKYHDEYIF